MSRLRYNPDCPTCRTLSPVQIEQTRSGGEWRILIDGRTVAHATCQANAHRLERLLVRGIHATTSRSEPRNRS